MQKLFEIPNLVLAKWHAQWGALNPLQLRHLAFQNKLRMISYSTETAPVTKLVFTDLDPTSKLKKK